MAKDTKEKLQRTASGVTRWVGSVPSIVVHTALFAGSFVLVWAGVLELDRMLLVLTTIVSLEAIYLAIFIQMTINLQAEVIEEVEHDIDEMQEDVEEIQEDIDEIQEDVDELQEDVEEMSEEEEAEEIRKRDQKTRLEEIHTGLQKLMQDIEKLQKRP